MTERSLFYRLGVRDTDRAVAELERFGDRGKRALATVDNAARPASAGLIALDRSVVQARQSIEGLAGRGGAVASVLGGIGAGGLAAAAGVGAAVLAWGQLQRALDQADKIAKTAVRVGVTAEALQELGFAAGLAGVDVANFNRGLETLTRRVGEAIAGTGELVPLAKQYGIALKGLDGTARDTADIFADLAEVIARTPDAAERARIAYLAFGRSGADLINVLASGRDGIDQMRERARELGIVIGGDLATAAEAANDAMSELGQSITARVNKALLEAAPLIARVAKGLSDLLVEGQKVGQADNDRARVVFDAVNDPFPGLRGLDRGDLEQRREVLSGSVDTLRANPDVFRRQAALVSKTLEEIEKELLDEIAEIDRRLDQGAAMLLDLEADFDGSDLAAVTDSAKEKLDKLIGSVDEIAKAEAERAAKLKDLDEVAKENNLTEERKAELTDRINGFYDERIKRIKAATEAGKAETAAEREAEQAARQLEERKKRLKDRVDALASSYSRTEAATIAYNRAVQDLDDAKEQGIISEQRHAELVSMAKSAYWDATRAAREYEEQVRAASKAGAEAAVPQFNLKGVLQQSVQAFGRGGFDLRSIGISALSQAGDFALDNLLEGRSPLSGLNIVDKLTNIQDALTSGFNGLSSSLGGIVASIFPAQSAAAGGAIFGAEAGIATQSALMSAGGASLAAAALPVIGIAAAGLALILSKAFGPGKSSGPALGASFKIGDEGNLDIRAFGADNRADPEQARALGDAVVQFTSAFLQKSGGTLRSGTFRGEVGFESGEFVTAISSPGLTVGDRRSGRSPDQRRFGSGQGAADRAVADFTVRSLLDALERGLVDGLSTTTSAVVKQVLERLDAEGVGTLEAAGEALDFATSFEDAAARMAAAGDTAALQLLDLGANAEVAAQQQGDALKAFKENLDRFFGERRSRPGGVGVSGVASDGRVAVSQFEPLIGNVGGDRDGNVGFIFNGRSYYRQEDAETGAVSFRDAVGGTIIPAVRDATGALRILADAIGAFDENAPDVVDPGDPARLAQGRAALDAYIDDLLGIGAAVDTDPLTGYALALEQSKRNFEEFRQVLLDLGLTTEQVEQKIAAANAAATDRARKGFNQSIRDQIVGLRSPSAAALVAIASDAAARRREALGVGGDAGLVDELARERLLSVARGEEISALQETVRLRATEISTLEGSISALDTLSSAIQRARDNQRLNEDIATPVERLTEAEAQFKAALATANDTSLTASARQDAARRAIELAPILTDAAKDVFGPQFGTYVDAVDAGLAGLKGTVDDELTLAREQLDTQKRMAATLEEQLAALRGDANPDRNFGVRQTRNRLLTQLFPEFTGDFGSGGFNSFFSGLSADDPRRDAAEEIIRSIGFAAGGTTPGGPVTVGEYGPEIVDLPRGSRVHSAGDSRSLMAGISSAIRQTGQDTAFGQQAIVDAIDDLRGSFAAMSQQLRILVAQR